MTKILKDFLGILYPPYRGGFGWGLLLFLAGCTNTAYDTGDSRYSYLRTDFADAQTNNSGQLVSAVTDESTRLTFTKPLAVSWKTTADSISRVMLYYNLNADASDSSIVEPLTAQYVYTFCVGVMTGKADSVEARQMIGLVLDSIAEKDHHPTYYLRFAHSQSNIPEYYTTNIYLSIPTKKMTTGSRVRLSLNTYKGWTTREFEW